MNLIRNERLKLLATYLNGMAIAIFAIGGLAQSFSVLYGNASAASASFLVFVTLSCLVASVALHYVASLTLKRLSQ